MSHLGHGRRLLFVDLLLPAPDQYASGVRALQLMTLLREWDWQVDFMPFLPPDPATSLAPLESLGVRLLPWVERDRLEDFIAQEARTCDRFLLVWLPVVRRLLPLLRTHAPGKPVIYDSQDVIHLREFREARVTGNARTMTRALHTKQDELQALREADLTIAITPADAAAFAALVPGASPRSVGIWAEPVAIARQPEPATLLFLGNMGAPHNHDCALFLANQVMPLLRDTDPATRLLLVGPPHNELGEKLNAPDITVAGWVADLVPLFARATAMVAPLRFGSGLKGKMLQSMAYGVPIVASSFAAEGMPLVPERDYLLVEDAPTTAAAVRRLLAEPALGRRLAAAALQTLREHYGRPATAQAFAAAMDRLG